MKIFINAKTIELDLEYMSYEMICEYLGYSPYDTLTITYSRGRNKETGSLSRGERVKLSEGMLINAGMTNNA